MAAYAALVSLMNDLDDIQNHPIHSFSFDQKQITSLSQAVDLLIDFIETNNFHGGSTEALESRIASAVHAAHDVIQSRVLDQLLAGSTLRGKSRSIYFFDLQKAIDNVEFVWRKAMHLKAKSGLLKAEQPPYSEAPAASTSGKTTMVGSDAVRNQLMHMLAGESSSNRRVIPLVGMGGIGKTTLAKNVYDHLYIQQHFDVRLWATISQQFSDETILTQLLYGESKSTGRNVNALKQELHEKLWSRRYLIVLDDMWSIDAWEMVQMFLPDNGNGSCVIVTTRLSNLADYLSSPPFDMNFLDEDMSWELFCGEAFGQGKSCPLELEKVGKKIVERCRGLPLSIIVVGGHLRKSPMAIEYWEKFAGLMNPISSSVKDEQCLKIIGLSYQHLPAHLKPCFLYLGIYKEDEEINASVLLKFWVAEGFLKQNKALMSLEEVAEDNLKDLIDRNLILVRERSWNGKAEYCGIHDIVRELCLKVGKKEKFMRVDEEGRGQAILRKKPCIMRYPERKHREFVGYLELPLPVRSRIGRSVKWWLGDGNSSLDFRSLRLSGFVKDCKSLAAAHFQLLNLRYLCCFLCQQSARNKRCYSFSSIFLFWNVKTLIIWRSSVSFIVPYEIWEMPRLRHLQFYESVCLPNPLPSENSNEEECIVLQNLHTLIGVEDLKLTEEVCRRMPNIKIMSLSYTTHDLTVDFDAILYYCPQNLCRFTKLESLTCYSSGDNSNWREVILSFTFPTSLKELCLWGCSTIDWEDLRMMIKSFPKSLEALELRRVKGTEFNLVEEEFPCLKILKLSFCDDWIYWNIANSSHFPVLEELHIRRAPKLREIPFDIGEIPTLRRIKLTYCSVSAAVSAVRIVVEQESFGNEDLQLDVEFEEKDEEESFQKMVQEENLRTNSLHLI